MPTFDPLPYYDVIAEKRLLYGNLFVNYRIAGNFRLVPIVGYSSASMAGQKFTTSRKFSAPGIKVQRSWHEHVQSDNVFKPSLSSPSGHLADSISINDANEAIKDVSSKRARVCECSFSGESLGTRLCSKCLEIKDSKFHSKGIF